MNQTDDEYSGLPPAPTLRRKAELRMQERTSYAGAPVNDADVRAMVHELQVHQLELEIQNEELQRAREAAEAASEEYFELFDFAPVAYFLWDHEGRILDVNLAGTELLGLSRKALVRKRFGQFVAEKHRAEFADFCRLLLATDSQQNCQIDLDKQGKSLHALIEGVAGRVRREQGRHACVAIIDVTERIRNKELAATNQVLQAKVDEYAQAQRALNSAMEATAVDLDKSTSLFT